MLAASIFSGLAEDRDFMQKTLEEIPLRISPRQLFYAEMPFKNSEGNIPEGLRNAISVYPREGAFLVFSPEESKEGILQLKEVRLHDKTIAFEWIKKEKGSIPVLILIHFKSKE